MSANHFDPYREDNIHPGFSVDCVILTFHKGKLKVLLRELGLRNYWALLGGFMFHEENADQAAHRILESYTGLKNIFLKQFHLFSDPARTIMDQNMDFVRQNVTSGKKVEWFLRRFISMGYFALVKYDSVALPNDTKDVLRWYDAKTLPPLYSDHKNIVETALANIRAMLPVIPVGYELLPEKFTMSELRKIYEIILEKTFDRRNFQRKVLSEGNVIQLKEKKSTRTYNPPSLFSFDLSKKDLTGIIH